MQNQQTQQNRDQVANVVHREVVINDARQNDMRAFDIGFLVAFMAIMYITLVYRDDYKAPTTGKVIGTLYMTVIAGGRVRGIHEYVLLVGVISIMYTLHWVWILA